MSIASLNQLYTRDKRRAGNVEVPRWYEFNVSPSCPPDKRLHIRGGYAAESFNFDGTVQQSYTPTVICDFENKDETDMNLVFDNANYYLPIILCYYGDWIAYRTMGSTLPIFDNVVGDEVETAAAAEEQIDRWMNGYTDWAYYRFPLWGVVLKNDGVVGVTYSILPIDLINRGRSYMYRDARHKDGLA